MTKVLVFLPSLWSGGGEKIAVDIAGSLQGEELDFLIVTYLHFEDTPAALLARKYGLRTVCLHKKPGFDPGIWVRLEKVIREYRPDVIHAHLKVMQYLLPPLMRTRVKKCLYTVHNLAEKDATGYMRYINLFGFKCCKVIPVAISDTCRQSLKAFYGVEGPCIYNGIDTGRYARREPYSALPDSPVRFLAVGRLGSQKNYPLMLRAFADARRDCPAADLTIIGAGELEQELRDLAGALGLEDCVRLAGVTDKVEEYMGRSHVYLMSSSYEGLPLVVLEAMSAGLPVVSTRAGGVIDIVRDGENGLLCGTEDQKGLTEAIVRMAGDRELRERISANNLRDSRQYDIGVCAAKYKELYLAD